MEFEEEFEKDPEEDPEEEQEADAKEDEPTSGSTFEVGGPSLVSSRPPHLYGCELKRLRRDTKSMYGSVLCLERGIRACETEIADARLRVDRAGRQMDAFDVDMGFTEKGATRTSDNVLARQEGRASDQEKMGKLERRLDSRELWIAKRMGWGSMEACQSDSIDILVVYGTAQPPEPQGPPNGPNVERLVSSRLAEDIVEYERNITKPENAGGAGPENAGGATAPNGNVHSLGLSNANQIPWSESKSMMTTEYCPETEIKRMEQELWTLTLKRDNIEGYNNRFHELAMMCLDLVTPERKKIERYVRGLPERVKANVTSSKPASLHEAIDMVCELIEQAIHVKAARIGESNKRK
uniref:Reverse transcriptase domain-containing protein n=1 Tax=Tanacetum cinerariifolium TaxID=118510 RepID=A0A6L2K7W5_TANCI|nr:reverse transcriptase domain-containing protein [Tanacetum cinerariifolium]